MTDYDAEGRLAFAMGLELRGELDRAVQAFEDIVEAGDRGASEALVRKHLGNLHLRQGHLRRSREHLTQACRLEPNNATFWHDLGVVHYYLADFDHCIECMRKAESWTRRRRPSVSCSTATRTSRSATSTSA